MAARILYATKLPVVSRVWSIGYVRFGGPAGPGRIPTFAGASDYMQVVAAVAPAVVPGPGFLVFSGPRFRRHSTPDLGQSAPVWHPAVAQPPCFPSLAPRLRLYRCWVVSGSSKVRS